MTIKKTLLNYNIGNTIELTAGGLRSMNTEADLPVYAEDLNNYQYYASAANNLQKTFYVDGKIYSIYWWSITNIDDINSFLLNLKKETNLSLYEMMIIYKDL